MHGHLFRSQRLVFDLDSHVIYTEFPFGEASGLANESRTLHQIVDNKVAAHGVDTRGDGPDVEVMHGPHAR